MRTGKPERRSSPLMGIPSLADILAKPFAIMGIVNVTPDSFYDGGEHVSPDTAIAHAKKLFADGADVLDIGGESSRPGAQPVSADDECRRILPVIECAARELLAPVSVDTTKADVARRALDSGASWINDISAGRHDAGMAALAAQRQCPVILMHSRGTPRTMQQNPRYADVVAEVRAELAERIEAFVNAGVARERIVADPGIGFAKRPIDNAVILRRIGELAALGPLLVGTSRKSFIGHITGRAAPARRLAGSLGSVAWAFLSGVRFFRVHDVAETRDVLLVLQALRTGTMSGV
jgi:dihydropteroate synthase